MTIKVIKEGRISIGADCKITVENFHFDCSAVVGRVDDAVCEFAIARIKNALYRQAIFEADHIDSQRSKL